MAARLYIDAQALDLGPPTRAWVAALRGVGVGAGARVLVTPSSPDSFVAIYQACRDLGAVPVIRTLPLRADDPRPDVAAWLPSANPEDTVRLGGAPPNHGSARVVLQTSGSTGAPRYVLQSEGAVAYQTRCLVDRLGYRNDMTMLLALPPWSAYGLTVLHAWQAMDIDLHLVRATFPRNLCRIIGERRVDAVDGTPQLYQLLHRYVLDDPNALASLTHVSLWCTGGDVLPVALARAWQQRLDAPLLDGYGSSEAGGNVAINGPSCFRMGTVGTPYPGTRVRVADDGELQVASPSVSGVLEEAGLGAEPCAPEWLATGDIATIDDDGFLAITGRKKNVLVVNGYKIAPELLERVLCEHEGVQGCVVALDVAGGDGPAQIVATLAVDEHGPTDRALRSFCAERLPKWAVPHRFVRVSALTYSANGKLARGRKPCPAP